jgi:hypothetical protein
VRRPIAFGQPLFEEIQLHPNFDHLLDQQLLDKRWIAADVRDELGLKVTSEASLGRTPIDLAQAANNSALKPTRVRADPTVTFWRWRNVRHVAPLLPAEP